MSNRTAIGLRVKDGVVLAVEKVIHSKLLVPTANRRIQTVDKHIGLVRRFILLAVIIVSILMMCIHFEGFCGSAR